MQPVSVGVISVSPVRLAALQAVLPQALDYHDPLNPHPELVLVDAAESMPALPARLATRPPAVTILLAPSRPDPMPAASLWLATPCSPATLQQQLARAWSERPRHVFGQYLFTLPPCWQTADGARIPLSDKEARLLAALIDTPDGLSREALLETLWGMDAAAVETHALETQLYRLRQKLAGHWPEHWVLGLRDGVCLFAPSA